MILSEHAFLFIRTLFLRTSGLDLAKKQEQLKNLLSLRFEDENNIFQKTNKIRWKTLNDWYFDNDF